MYKIINSKAPITNPNINGELKVNNVKILDENEINQKIDSSSGVSSDFQTALDTKAPLNNPNFTGTVNISNLNSGIMKLNNQKNIQTVNRLTTQDMPEQYNITSHDTLYENISFNNMSNDWSDLTTSSDGQIVLAVSKNLNYIYISRDAGNNWKPVLPTLQKNWSCCAMSKIGSTMVVGATGDFLYISKDYGYTWNTFLTTSTGNYTNIAVSDDGNVISAIAGNTVFVSINGGETWASTVVTNSLLKISISGNGQKQVLISSVGNLIYISNDYGSTWITKQPLTNNSIVYFSIILSNDGSKIYLISNRGNFIVSNNDFTTFDNITLNITGSIIDNTLSNITIDESSNKIFVSSKWFLYVSLNGETSFNKISQLKKTLIIKTSADGNVLYGTNSNISILKSIDNGSTWTSFDTESLSKNFTTCAMSDDGSVRAVAGQNTYIYVSIDNGNTWNQTCYDFSWRQIAMSSNGQYIVAISSSLEYIYISSDYGNMWNIYTNPQTYVSIAISGNGQKIMAITGQNRTLYTSNDYGVTWTTNNSIDNTGSFTVIRMSKDGNYIYIGNNNSKLMVSSDGGTTWNAKNNVRNWVNFGISGDGKYILASISGSNIMSNDYGVTFGLTTINASDGIALSDNGRYQYACSNSGIFVSSDYGSTFVTFSSAVNFRHIATTSNGLNSMVALITTGQIPGGFLISNDYGVTWLRYVNNKFNFASIASSSNGTYQAGCIDKGFIYVSNNNGLSWTKKETFQRWNNIVMSDDGKCVTATTINNYLYISSDYGETWTVKFNDVARSWVGLAMSVDGKYQSATAVSQFIYVSSDYGNTWIPKDFPRNYGSIAMSSNGQHQTVMINNGHICVSNDYGNTWSYKLRDGITGRTGRIVMSLDGKTQIMCQYGVSIFWMSTDYGNSWNWRTGDSRTILSTDQLNDGSFVLLSSNAIIFMSNDGQVMNSTYVNPSNNFLSLHYIKNNDTIIVSSETSTLYSITKNN